MSQISNEMDVRPIPPNSRKFILKDVLSNIKLDPSASNSLDLNSLMSTREESDSWLDSIRWDFPSSFENHDMLAYVSSSFASKDDLTYCLSSTNINFDPSMSEKYLSAVTSDLESVNSADYEDYFVTKKLRILTLA